MSVRGSVVAVVFLSLSLGAGPSSLYSQQTFDPLQAFNANGFDQNRNYFSGLPIEHVDPMTGNVILTFTDLVLPGNAGFDLKIQRIYNSKIYRNFHSMGDALGEDSWAGVGWSMHLGRILDPEGSPVVEMSDGSRHPAYRHIDSSGRFITKEYWVYNRNLIAPTLSLTNGVVYEFGAHINGMRHVTGISDPFGNEIQIAYGSAASGEPADGIKKITQHLSSTSTREVDFEYETSAARKNLKSITYTGERTYTWTYVHTTVPVQGPLHSLLKEVKPPEGPSWLYQYNESSSPRYELTRVTAPGGGFTSYSYSTVPFYNPGSVQIVNSRAATGKATGGHDIPSGTWTFSYAEGTNKDRSTFDTPCGQIKYQFLGIGNQTSQVEAWQVGLQAFKEIRAGTVVLEREEFAWKKGAPISTDPYFTGLRTDADTWVPLLEKRTVTRGGRTFTTENSYGTGSFNDFGRPNRVVETGDRSRTTEYDFDYSFSSSLYLKDRIESEETTGTGGPFQKSYAYDNATGFKESETVYGVTTTFSSDDFGNVDRVTDATLKSTGFTYAWGVLKNTITPAYTITRTVVASGLVTSVLRRAFTTTFSYDKLFRPTTIDPPLGANLVYSYDQTDGQWMQLTRGATTQRTELDGYGRPSATSNAAGVKTDMSYDACGRMTYQSYPFEGTANKGAAYEYDPLGRVTRRLHPDGAEVVFDYDGLDVEITNERGFETTQEWEAFGDPSSALLTGVVDRDDQEWSYDYDVLGNLLEVDPPGTAPNRTWAYNTKSQLTSETHPESGTIAYTYHANGKLATRTDPAFGESAYTYDNNNRLTRVDWPGDAFTDLGYDDSDNRTLLETELVRAEFGYDGANRLTSRSDFDHAGQFTFTAGFDYDSRDNLQSITYPSEGGERLKVEYGYDNANRITRVAEVGGSGEVYAQNFQYHPSGGMEQFLAGNGYVHHVDYDPNRYWVNDIYDDGGSEPVLDLHYTYDGAGNVATIEDTRPGMLQEFSYDPLDRLEQAKGPWGTIDYGYDVQGNRTAYTRAGNSTAFEYSGTTNRLTSATGAQPDSFGYDGNGNLRTTSAAVFSYSPRNMVISSAVGGVSAAYGYDGDNLRTYKASGSETRHYFRGPGDLLLSEFETGCGAERAPARDYIYAGSRLVAAVKYRPDPPVLISPKTATNDTTPTFEWAASNGADGYEILVENLTDSTTALNADDIDDTSYTPASALPSGKTYRWQVRAESGSSTSCYSDPETFDIDVAAPAAVMLVASAPGPGVIQLTWTAPGDDGNTGTAAAYDIRYQQGGVINFDTATQATAEPLPLAAGAPQSFQILGLPPETSFAVALKTIDDAGNVSALSNVATQTTVETTPPEAVTGLQALNPGFTSVDLQWTAPHEDGALGGAVTAYDIRYAAFPITPANFPAAAPVTGAPAPLAPGLAQSMTVSNLQPATHYFFALRSTDDAGNSSGLSNVVVAETLDNVPPAPVSNLAIGYYDDDTVDVHWSSTGDDGTIGVATSFDLRYSTIPIAQGNFSSATPAAGEPAPAPSGTAHRLAVTDLLPGTTYYVALTVTDDQGNVSPLSNVASFATYADLPEPLMTNPAAGAALTGSAQVFQWSANGLAATQWWLYVGTTRGALDIYNSQNLGGALSHNVTGLPANGSAVWVRLWYYLGFWGYEDFSFTAYTPPPPPPPPQLTSPTPGSTLAGASALFQWTANATVATEWWVYAGSTQGGKQYYDSGSLGTAMQANVTGLPTNGSVVHMRLFYRVAGLWQWQDFQYTAPTGGGGTPEITSPVPSSTLASSSALFEWTANGAGVSEWWLFVGETAGGAEIHNSGSLGAATQRAVAGLPADGSQVHARLWYRIGTTWQFADFQYTTASLQPILLSPAPSSTLTSSSALFQWTANGTTVTEWWLFVGTTSGGAQIYNSGSLGSAAQVNVSGLPTNGSTLYVSLWYRVSGLWESFEVQYTAANLQPAITSPAPGSVLTGSSQLFQWTANGYPITEWWIYAGSAPETSNYYNSGSLGLATSATAVGLPTGGVTIHVTLYYRIAGLWQWTRYQYTASP